jgi:hypothetical protein
MPTHPLNAIKNIFKILLTTIKGVFKRIINDPVAPAKFIEKRFESINLKNTRPMSCCFIKTMHSTASSQNHTIHQPINPITHQHTIP